MPFAREETHMEPICAVCNLPALHQQLIVAMFPGRATAVQLRCVAGAGGGGGTNKGSELACVGDEAKILRTESTKVLFDRTRALY